MADLNLQMDLTNHGFCPVQVEGTVNGHPFYFRARWDEWSFSISLNPDVDVVGMTSSEGGFYREEKYGMHRHYAASYMPDEDIETTIRQCAHEFITEHPEVLPS